MLYRTNRTLSANLNRLYLGTRSLVLNLNETHGKLTLRVRHADSDRARVGMHPDFAASSIPSRAREKISGIPSSSLVGPWSVPGRVVDPLVVDPPVMPRPVFGLLCLTETQGQGGWTQQTRNQSQTSLADLAGRVKHERSRKREWRLRLNTGLYAGHARARATAASTAAATVAATGG